MKIIFDFGANQGQNLNYFLEKADIVIACEANSNLVLKIKSDFKEFIDKKKLIVENIALIDDENIKKIDFFVAKGKKSVMSTLFPDSIHNYYRQEVECGKASTLIKKYLKIFNTSEIEYIKIDIEGADKLVLNDLIKNDILAKNLSVECNDPEVIEFLLKSKYKFFKLVKGADSFFKENVEIITKDKKKKFINFDKHSSGPYGDDIPGSYYDKKSIIPYFLNNGLLWTDVHCSFEKKGNLQNIQYISRTHLSGFRYHLINLIPQFIKAVNDRFKLLKRKFKKHT